VRVFYHYNVPDTLVQLDVKGQVANANALGFIVEMPMKKDVWYTLSERNRSDWRRRMRMALCGENGAVGWPVKIDAGSINYKRATPIPISAYGTVR